ncbi:hypothetical protein DSO57_1023122 [Entomophthora muscae]|uniref:Uncharacterized protein n=1 Tax=Entomophthora muscae TaxID=34485 RepID=A0ACC2UCF2_9FUNG|nr:hypothetical protein DSO57_1023122 [Entomophthora muscae]
MEVAHNLHRHTVNGGYTLIEILPPAGKREDGEMGMEEQLFWQSCKPKDASQDQGVLDHMINQVCCECCYSLYFDFVFGGPF